MIDVLIIATFFFTRYSPQVVSFGMRFLRHIHVLIVLNALFLLVFYVICTVRLRSANTYSIGWTRPSRKALLYGILSAVLLIGLGAIINSISNNGIVQQTLPEGPLVWSLLLLLLAAPAEEFFYRSYMLARFLSIKVPVAVSVVISSLLFSLGHSTTGLYGIIFSFIAGLLVSTALLYTKSCWTPILAHTLYNVVVYAIFFA